MPGSPCCPNVNIPVVLYLTFSNGTGNCACFNGVTVPLTFAGTGTWACSTDCIGLTVCGVRCGAGACFTMQCASNNLVTLSLQCGVAQKPDAALQCSPFLATFSGVAMPGTCCPPGGGTVDAIITA